MCKEALIAMAGPHRTGEHLIQYLQRLTPQVRSRLLVELERLHLLGEDIPHSEPLIAALRAEFRGTGQNHYRAGNPSRYFFEPLEPVLVDGAPERANSGQIARGSLGPIWSFVSEKLLPSMAADYVANAKGTIAANDLAETRRIAATFQKKVLTYLDGTLGLPDGAAEVRAGLMAYTSSHATFDDLMKMRHFLCARPELADFTRALAPKIPKLDGPVLANVLKLLGALKSKRSDAVPFALTIIAGRLERPRELMLLATIPAGSRTPAEIAATPYAIAVSMVLDQIDEKRLLLLFALRNNRMVQAKEIVGDIYKIEQAVRERIDLTGSGWGKRLQDLMTALQAALDAEISSIPTDHLHLTHILESSKLRPDLSFGDRITHFLAKSRKALGWSASKER